MIKVNVVIVSLSLALSMAAMASEKSLGAQSPDVSLEQAKVMQAQQVALSISTAPIRSRADLFTYLHGVSAPISPLYKLSPGARDRFLASLTFNENGITGFSYEDLKNELTASDIYKVLSLFGAQHDIALIKGVRAQSALDRAILLQPMLIDDHEGYACVGRATCNARMSYICMTGC